VRVLAPPPLDERPHNLPAQVSSFVGRARELAELRQVLSRTRLLTLAGPGGIGKTRLALALAENVLSDYTAGVWLVELAPMTDSALVIEAVAAALRIGQEPGISLLDSVTESLSARQLLLVLDNCEHVIQASAELAQALLQACPELRVLTASREPLGMAGETIWRVPGLTMPEPHGRQLVGSIDGAEAAQLLVERARAVTSSFEVTPQNAAAVAELCHQLDGMPLAIELAAARMKVLSPEQVTARLGDQLELLTTGSRTAPARQQTLRATLDWSYNLLCEPEQQLFNRLSVFAGGCTLEGAEGICGAGGLSHHEFVDVLGRLVDKSLVLCEPGSEGAARYRLLQPVRQYAHKRLVEHNELEVTQEKHAAFFLALTEQEVHTLRASADPVSARLARLRLEREHNNLRAALGWLIEMNDVGRAWRLGADLCNFWYLHLHGVEGRTWVARLLELESNAHMAARIALLRGAGLLAWGAGDLSLLQARGEESVALSRAWHPESLPFSLWLLGMAKMHAGEFAVARALNEEGLAASRAAGQHTREVLLLLHLAALARLTGDYAEALARGVEARSVADAAGYLRGSAGALSELGYASYYKGDYAAARSFFADGLARLRADGQRIEAGAMQIGLGLLAVEDGDLPGAHAWLKEALSAAMAGSGDAGPCGNYGLLNGTLDGFAFLAAACGQSERALRLASGAAAFRERIGLVSTPIQSMIGGKHLAPARIDLGEQATATVEEAGRSMTLQELVEVALAVEAPGSERPDQQGTAAGGQHSPLTPREQQVAALLARGLSNRQIACELVVAEYTAERHVHNVLNKLGLTSRSQVAAWAFEHVTRSGSRELKPPLGS
jgi:predicted ATPase/DNA-binding CsgD family transcriptional regulator